MRKQMGRAAFSHLFGRGDLGDGAVLRYPAAASDGRVKSADPFVLRVSRRAGGEGPRPRPRGAPITHGPER